MNTPTSGEHRLLEAVIRVENMGSDILDIKQSVRDMATAITRLAVFEERQTHDRDVMGQLIKSIAKHDERIGNLELAQPLQNLASAWVQKAVWLVVAAALSAMLTLVIASRTPDIVARTSTKTTTEVQR